MHVPCSCEEKARWQCPPGFLLPCYLSGAPLKIHLSVIQIIAFELLDEVAGRHASDRTADEAGLVAGYDEVYAIAFCRCSNDRIRCRPYSTRMAKLGV